MSPDDPVTTVAPETTMAPSPVPPVTTASPDPSVTLETCHACLTICAPCKQCAENGNTTFAYGDCEKCWSCWNYKKDKLHKNEKKMAKHCDAMHFKHKWDSHKV